VRSEKGMLDPTGREPTDDFRLSISVLILVLWDLQSRSMTANN